MVSGMRTKTPLILLLIGSGLLLVVNACTKGTQNRSGPLHVDQNFNFPPGFPPDPGVTGKKTLNGIDSDHDGLRDDLQRWIYARYPTDENKRKALRQMAISYQRSYQPALTGDQALADAPGISKAIACLHQIFPGGQDATIEREFIKAKALNTKQRIDQFLENDAKVDGKMLGPLYPDDGTACEK